MNGRGLVLHGRWLFDEVGRTRWLLPACTTRLRGRSCLGLWRYLGCPAPRFGRSDTKKGGKGPISKVYFLTWMGRDTCRVRGCGCRVLGSSRAMNQISRSPDLAALAIPNQKRERITPYAIIKLPSAVTQCGFDEFEHSLVRNFFPSKQTSRNFGRCN